MASTSRAYNIPLDDLNEDMETMSPLEIQQKDSIINSEKVTLQRLRSNSDGDTLKYHYNGLENFDIFPSLPDSVLRQMGLLGEGNRIRLSEEELEQKFISLSLAFSIDSETIDSRCERQKRFRDQTETNLAVEIQRLIEKAKCMQPLCIDAETTELLSALLSQIDIVVSAASHATISSERYGAVQHEQRISESVNLMINHVNVLRQQRDSARKQLQYTKKVLQNSNNSPTSKVQSSNSRQIGKRRASIATIVQQSDPVKSTDFRKMTRRTSDLSLRATSLTRNSRPGRLELGLDLMKIKEGFAENGILPDEETLSDDSTTDNDKLIENKIDSSLHIVDDNMESNRHSLIKNIQIFQNKLTIKYNKWINNGFIHEFFSLSAVLCFSISIIILANILIQIESNKRGIHPSNFFWFLNFDNERDSNVTF